MPPKVKLTPEEKKALKLAKKEEKKRQKIEKAKQLKRDYLGREVKYGDLTLKGHEKEWRQMLINLALPKMREDLEFAWHNFERVIDCKNFTISLLMDEIKYAEDQYVMNNRNHIENIDRLIDIFQERIEELQEDYDDEVHLLKTPHNSEIHFRLESCKKRGEEEVKEIILQTEEDENYIKTMSHILDVERKVQKQNVRAEYFSKLEEEQRKYAYIIKLKKGLLEKTFQDIMKDTVQFLHHYERQTKTRSKEHDELKGQDDAMQELLVGQLEKIRQGCEYIKILRVKLNDSQKLLSRKLKDIQDEHDLFAYAFSALKQRLELDRKTDLQQLITLTVNYNDTMENLDKLKAKVESILQLSAVCRKLETQKEKVKPFPMTGCDPKSVDDRVSRSSIIPSGEVEEEQFLSCMELFWQRVAQADSSRYAINEEREFLKTQNELLKYKLYQYCQCISCPMTEKNVLARGVKHVTEGALEQQKYEKQKVPQFGRSRLHLDIDA
ncbi:hypothetical protein NQ318_015897 [Aromia moschata]|uniref:Dynein regulatory complex subunit 2 n=1 Tax=Aromia moschata TaxID=1265417 RepID=A0AAV8Y1Y8_9CUCU|nr:hypothetical protein NQ318_015897 [Aromia moschata]